MKNSKKKIKYFNISENYGITLVALIITIIILIILAAVSISTLTHEGFAQMAINGTQQYDKAQTDEIEKLDEIDDLVRDTLLDLEEQEEIEPTNPEYFSFNYDSTTKTATLTGIKEEYQEKRILL